MQITCPHCSRSLEITGDPPAFCAYCGHSLSTKKPVSTIEFKTEAATQPPAETDTPAPDDEEVPEVVGGYRLMRRLGRGGMGSVHEGEEIATGRRVAIKLISRDYGRSFQAVERFRQEGRLASLITHPRCVFVYAAEEEAGQAYIVMELMPGATLQELVEQNGPLPTEEAVAKVLDILEGLEEAHRKGVIHRDVKPSNCFIETNGRIKIGDFGLSKSLVQGAHLTRTGAFLGTPLYASPEQVRAQLVDESSDVYSAAATLYFLLTGRAPHQSGDAAATLARIASDPAPSMREFRPDIPEELDAIVRRALERARERRWPSLGDFRDALAPFLPGQLSIGGMGMRFGAYVIDSIGLQVVQGILLWTLYGVLDIPRPQFWLAALVGVSLTVLYYGFLEGFWGWSFGKLLLGLRVRRPAGIQRPGLGRAFLRAAVLVLCLNLGSILSAVLLVPYAPTRGGDFARLYEEHFFIWLQSLLLPWTSFMVAAALLFSTARARNGYRGLHEILSGTRVVGVPQPRRRGLQGIRYPTVALLRPPGLPESVGPYEICGALRWSESDKLLLGEDQALARKVWIWLRPEAEGPLSAERRQVTRLSRLRCLGNGCETGWRWDAFVAPEGALLTDLVHEAGRLAWPDVRLLLEELADELMLAREENPLPSSLSLDHVWVEPNGHVQLLDMRGPSARSDPAQARQAAGPLDLLRAVASVALEGRARAPGDKPSPPRAPLPGHATRTLGRLFTNKVSDSTLMQLRDDLRTTRGQPDEVTRSRRTAHVALVGALLCVGLFQMYFAGWITGFTGCWMSHLRLGIRARIEQTLPLLNVSEFAAASTNPLPFERARVATQFAQDATTLERLRHGADEDRRQHEAFLQALSPVLRNQEQVMEQAFDEQLERHWTITGEVRDAAEEFTQDDESRLSAHGIVTVSAVLVPILIVLWPAVWIVFAFLTRGGLSFRLMGIRLADGLGRPAARWRCAWRTLVLWLPLVALLLTSAWAESTYWARWFDNTPEPSLLWASSAGWWLAVVLLITYAVIALWFPTRGPHDRLAGTYVVPR
jgi:hypothetical protein